MWSKFPYAAFITSANRKSGICVQNGDECSPSGNDIGADPGLLKTAQSYQNIPNNKGWTIAALGLAFLIFLLVVSTSWSLFSRTVTYGKASHQSQGRHRLIFALILTALLDSVIIVQIIIEFYYWYDPGQNSGHKPRLGWAYQLCTWLTFLFIIILTRVLSVDFGQQTQRDGRHLIPGARLRRVLRLQPKLVPVESFEKV